MNNRTQMHTKATPETTPTFTAGRPGLLQRTCACGGTPGLDGECAACRRKRMLGLSTKLAVNVPGDRLEQEADRVAAEFTRMPEPAAIHPPLRLQRWEAHLGGPTGAPPIVDDVLRSPGQPLDETIRALMEPRFGHDFSQVRVHTDASAVEAAQAVHALAYTVGQDVVFASGHYAPHTDEGRKLLAHELTHVVQQGDRRAWSGTDFQVGLPEDSRGRQADTLGAPTIPAPALVLQRKCEENDDESFYQSAPNYCSDTWLSGLLHPGQRCYREVPTRSGPDDCPPGDQVCFDEKGCHNSRDEASPVEGKDEDGECNIQWIGPCADAHAEKDKVFETFVDQYIPSELIDIYEGLEDFYESIDVLDILEDLYSSMPWTQFL